MGMEKVEWQMIATRITNGSLIKKKKKKFKNYIQFHDRLYGVE